jgi:hypothetical protein
MTSPDNLDALSNLGVQSATLATLIWFGRRFLAQHDGLIRRLDSVISESAESRASMERAREAFEQPRTRRARRTPPKRRIAATLALTALAPIALSSCSVDSSYVAADRATYDAVAPFHRHYVESDPTLDPDQRELALLILDTWRIRLETAEK